MGRMLSVVTICMCMFSICQGLVRNDPNGEVKVLPFVTLYKEHKSLQIIEDYYNLVQRIDLGELMTNMINVTESFKVVRYKYYSLNDTPIEDYDHLEQKLQILLEHSAQKIDAGISMLPQRTECLLRNKRSIEIDQEPVIETGLFPGVGSLFSWLTGTLSAQAGTVINENYNNIKKLTKLSLNFAQMFNATLSIEQKHKAQINNLRKQVREMDVVLTEKISIFERKLSYQGFLTDLMLIVLDLQHSIERIFRNIDQMENNNLGSLARDNEFITAVAKLMDVGTSGKKADMLYLMKISAQVEVEACGPKVQVIYKFPVLKRPNFVPWRTVSVPKDIKMKYFELSSIPYMVTWHNQVFSWTELEYRDCQVKNNHVFCKIPNKVQEPINNCIYGLLKNLPWEGIADKCELSLVENPKSRMEFTESHVIYINMKKDLLTLMCPDVHPSAGTKPFLLEGSGVMKVPAGCKVKFGESQSFTMGHRRSVSMGFNMNDKVWKLNMTKYIPILKVKNVGNLTSLWDDSVEERRVIEEGLQDNYNILSNMTFSHEGVTYTLWSIIGYTMVVTVILVVTLVFACNPMFARSFICCGCCRKPKVVSIPVPRV